MFKLKLIFISVSRTRKKTKYILFAMKLGMKLTQWPLWSETDACGKESVIFVQISLQISTLSRAMLPFEWGIDLNEVKQRFISQISWPYLVSQRTNTCNAYQPKSIRYLITNKIKTWSLSDIWRTKLTIIFLGKHHIDYVAIEISRTLD